MEIIEINGDTLIRKFMDLTGKVHDEFQLKKANRARPEGDSGVAGD
jgi:hypothetical protein